MVDESELIRAVKGVFDVEIPLNVYDLGLIRELRNEDGKVFIKMTWTSPLCPYGPLMVKMVEDAVKKLDGVVDVLVRVELDPPWSPEEMTEDGRRQIEIIFGREAAERWLHKGD